MENVSKNLIFSYEMAKLFNRQAEVEPCQEVGLQSQKEIQSTCFVLHITKKLHFYAQNVVSLFVINVESVHARHVLKSVPRTNNVILSNEILEQHIQIYSEVWKVQLDEQLNAVDIHAAKLVEIINKVKDAYKDEILLKNAKNKLILKQIEEESDNNNPSILSLIQTTFTPSKIDFLRIKRQFEN
ncbi:unnamed protein product [Mytilus edulis]|uniref:Uncharacterized protein n=1 Tax=Mytilus edulis TaxID=6550 RepID=A0A8S3V7L1_MYTED|nr:unnamed protein product [Mytilus edulis]